MSGDGSSMYSIQALWTAAHHDLPIVFVILANREYRVLKHNIDAYRARFDVKSNKPYMHMDLSGPVMGFVDLAKGMGVAVHRAWMEYIDEPSPEMQRIGRSGSATATPSAPATPWPMPPPRPL